MVLKKNLIEKMQSEMQKFARWSHVIWHNFTVTVD